MALPTISHNTPAAGSISWTGFSIAYAGGSYNIAAGSTSNAYVWWLFNGGVNPALQSGNALPNLGPDDMILFLNKAGTGVLVPTAELLDGSLIVGGSILAGAIGANQIQTSHLSANAVTADQIAANAVVAKHLAAGTVTADKLSVGTVSDNMVVNGSFEDALSGTLVGWEVNAMTGGTISPVTGVASSGAVSMQMAATATTANLRFRQQTPQFIPVSAASGRRYYVAVRAGVSAALTTGFYFRVLWHDANKVQLTTGGFTDIRSNGSLTTTFTIYEGQATPPATARYMSFEILLVNPNVVTTVYVDEVIAHEVTMSAQIGDGQISAVKILANSITADRIQAGTITTDKLAISDQTNYVRDPGLEYGGAGWTLPTGGTIATITDPRVDGTKVMQMVAGAAVRDATSAAFPVRAGDWYYASCWVRKTVDGSTTGTIQLGATIDTKTPTGAATWEWPSFASRNPTQFPLNTWVLLDGAVQMPANARSLQLRPSVRNDVATGTYQFDDFQLRRMNGGELIVDGVIVAAKIAADAITADKIATNAVTADAIAANAVVAESISANALNGKTITGATIQTAASGARIVLNATSLKGWDANNLNYLTADANGLSVTGTVSATGVSKDWVTNANVNIKATLGNKTARNTWVGYDFQQPGVYFEKDGVTQNTIDMPRLIAKYTDTMSAESAHTPVNAAGDLNVINQSSFTAAPSGASLGSKKYDKRLNEDGGAGVAGVLSSASIIAEPDAVVARAEDGADTYYGSWLMALGSTGTDGSSSYPGITQGAEIGFRPGGNDPNQSKAFLKMDRPGTGGAHFDLYSSSGTDVNRIYTMGNTLNLESSNVNINGARMAPLQHAEFTSTMHVPGSTPWGSGTMTLDTARSVSHNFVNHFAGDKFRVTEAGVYNVSVTIETINYSGSINHHCILRRVSDNLLLFGGAKPAGAWEWQLSSSIYLAANEEFRVVYYHDAPSGQDWRGRVRITKTSAMSAPAALPGTSHTLTGNLTVDGETYIKHRRAEFNNGWFDVAANAAWDIGPQTLNTTAPSTLNNDFCKQGPWSGSIEFTKSGYYSIMAFVDPQSGDGGAWMRLWNVQTSKVYAHTGNGRSSRETTLTTVPIYIEAGQSIRFTYAATWAHAIKSWVTVVKSY